MAVSQLINGQVNPSVKLKNRTTTIVVRRFLIRTTLRMKNLLSFSFLSLFLATAVSITGIMTGRAQQASVHGVVTDAFTRESLPGVNVVLDLNTGTSTDDSGYFELQLPSGPVSLTFRFIGYKDEVINLQLKPGEMVQRNVQLHSGAIELTTAVISASRYEQRLSDVNVSMEVIPAEFIERVNTRQLDETVNLLPGVDVLDGQANIRGGSGYSYGAGSRVLMLLDDLPLLSGDINDVKWNAIPLETIGQVEIIKGASAALYGSSALNGVINLRSAAPGIIPSTTIELNTGIYTKPDRDEMTWWWNRNPYYGGIRFSHLRKAGPVDISLGGSGYFDEGYRDDNYQRYVRFNTGIRYNPEKVKGFSAGFRTNIQYQGLSDFLIWQDADSGAFLQNPAAISPSEGLRLNIDPYLIYYNQQNGRHSLKARYYKVSNRFPEDPDKNNGSDYYFAEYQFLKMYRNGLNLSAGGAGSYTAGTSNLYGDHSGSTIALYTQLDYKFFNKLSASFGVRWERYTLDKTDDESRPVVRAGLNYEAAKYTFIRASFGQGYRYPSMAEKYTATTLGALNVFPNPELQAETGWSTELGLRQGIKLGIWSGFIDVAGFWTEYQDMMEFTFGIYQPDSVPYPTLEHLGFKSLNTGNARISGVDVSISGHGRPGKINIEFFTGYTYMDPVDLSPDTSGQIMLKYRHHHAVKGDISVEYRDFSAGITCVYTSYMERIDAAFEEEIFGQEILPGLKEYREKNDQGAVIVDLRLGWQISTNSHIGFFIKNLFNVEYMGRPGDVQAPCSLSLQYVFKI